MPLSHVIYKTMLLLVFGVCNSQSCYIIYYDVVTCHTWLLHFLSAALCDASWKLATAGEILNEYGQMLLMTIFQMDGNASRLETGSAARAQAGGCSSVLCQLNQYKKTQTPKTNLKRPQNKPNCK